MRVARRVARRLKRSASPVTPVPVTAAASAPSTAAAAMAPSPAPRPFALRRHGTLVPRGPDRLVVLVVDDPRDERLTPWLEELSDDRVHVIATVSADHPEPTAGLSVHRGQDLEATVAALSVIGAPDLVVVLRAGGGDRHAELWERLFFFVKKGGAYIVPRDAIVEDDVSAGLLTRLLETVVLQSQLAGTKPDEDFGPPLDVELAFATDRVLFGRRLIIVGKLTKHYVKVREAVANELVRARPGDTALRVLTSLPAGELHSTATVTSYASSAPVAALETSISYPQLELREYTGRVGVLRQSLVVTDDLVLPDSFRWHQVAAPHNPATINSSADFARVRGRDLPKETLSGSYYLLDSTFYAHFGHLMTEVVSKLWGWDQAKREFPDLKAIYRPGAGQPEVTLAHRLFTAFGIGADDIVRLDRAVWVERLVGATPMWHNERPHFVHPDIASVWDRLATGIEPVAYDGARKIFVHRDAGLVRRQCRNADEVAALFAARGFDIVYPERMDVSEQAGMFRDAEVVAGFGGSGLFNVLYCGHLQTLIVLNHEAYTARNEHLYALVKGCDTHYFWSEADLAHDPDLWSEDAFRSSWEFDLARNRDLLVGLLDSLS